MLHTCVIVSDSGKLLACGSNSKGQLGVGTLQDVHTLTRVTALKATVVMVTGGWDFSIALSGNTSC